MNAVAEKPTISPSRFEFDQYGVNNRYNTERQEAEFLRMQNKQLIEYAERHLEITLKMKDIKQMFKDLDRDFKERGFDVATSKRVLKSYMKELQKSPEDLETEAIVKEWLASSSKITSLISAITEFDENAKVAWEEQAEERQKARMEFTKQHFQERRKREEEAGLGWIDFEVERLSKLVHLGHTDSIPKLEEMKEQVRIRNERREAGLPMLPEHDQPAYPDQWLERKAKERAERESQEVNKWAGYQEPDDVKACTDEELAEYAEFATYRYKKHGGSHFRVYVDLIAEEQKKRDYEKMREEKRKRGEMWKAKNLAELEVANAVEVEKSLGLREESGESGDSEIAKESPGVKDLPAMNEKTETTEFHKESKSLTDQELEDLLNSIH